MRLSADAVLFEFYGIPIVGSKTTSRVIGLTAQARDVLERMVTEDVPAERVDAVDPGLATALVEDGMVAGHGSTSAQAVRQAYVHVTQRCNLDCAGCYSRAGTRNRLPDAPREKFAAVFSKLSAAGVKSVVLSGGEPFLRDDLAGLCADAKESGIENVTVLTNGLAANGRRLEELAPFVDCVSVSFDGPSSAASALVRGEQRFNELVDAVRATRKAGIRPHIIPTIHRRNINDVHEYVRLAGQLGATLNFSVLSCCGDDLTGLLFDEDSLKKLAHAIYGLGEDSPFSVEDVPVGANLSLRSHCGAGIGTLSVDADGSVYPCHMLHYEELCMGSIFEDPIDEIVRSGPAISLSRIAEEGIDECAGCESRYFCAGGCRARAYAESGALNAKDPYCAMMKEFYSVLGERLSEAFG